MSYLLNAIMLLLTLVFNAAVIVFMLRLAAEAGKADFRNPLSQLIYRATNKVLRPIRRVLPNWRTVNLAALLVIWLLMWLKLLLLYSLTGVIPQLAGLLVLAMARLIDFAFMFYIVLVFVWSLLSLLASDLHQPLQRLLNALIEPLLRPLRGKLVWGMMDFSPAAVIIALLLGQVLLAAPLLALGKRLAVGG